MNRRILLYLLLALQLLMVGCGKEKESYVPPVIPDIPVIPEGTIPVVFHVLWDDDPTIGTLQSPNSDVFLERIGQLNKFYKDLLFSKANSEEVDVTFMLATHTPKGNEMAESGVNRIHYPRSSDMSVGDFLEGGTPKGRPLTPTDINILWDPNKYVNIWLFGFDSQTEYDVTGVAYLAYATSAYPLIKLNNGNWAISNQPDYMHGIALNNKYFSPVANIPLNEDEGMFTLCHEMGHYLGLFHTFIESPVTGEDHLYKGCGDDITNNASDDGCSDTPKYERVLYEKLLNNYILNDIEMPYNPYQRKSCEGELFVSTNIMDYYMGFRTNISADQRARIEHVLTYSPWIPRSTKATKALLENFTGEITDERPVPILMY